MTVFRLPDLGEGLSEAEVLKWHVGVGDRVSIDQPMLSVETAKAVVEVPSPVSGTVRALHAGPGDRIETGAPLVEFAVEGTPDGTATPVPAATVVGHMPAAIEDYPPGRAPAASAARRVEAARPRAVPAARALARHLGIELASCTGSGSGGLVTLDDVLARAGDAVAGTARRASTPAPLQAPPGTTAEVEQLAGLRRAMSQSMSAAREQVAPCSVFDDADLRGWSQGADFSVRMLRALAVAARSERALNAWYDAAHGRRLLFDGVDVGVAVDTPEGLLVPVIRGVQALDARALRAELDRIKAAAHERTLPAADLRNCTIMLSNFGSMAGRYATPVVVPPAVAIVAAGRIRPERQELPLSLSFDHRVVTGGEAVRFLRALISDLELPS